ncbi:uncharacterized protein PG986_011469 [Apiospora aurea]|uniref:DUF7918 domain-containing protein n=1 Tax=Apiospora aurea TaxID=335848 RepID=A0ABR1Q541_9PEZI
MAVIEDVPGVEIRIAVAGAPAKEYGDPDLEVPNHNDSFLSSVYIECLDGQEFAFRYKDHQLKFKFYIGGNLCDRRPLIEEATTRSGPVMRELRKQVEYNEATKKWYSHRFVFTAVEKVDDANKQRVEEDKKIAKHLGVLKVEVWRATVHTHHNPPSKTGASNSTLDEGEPIEYKPSRNTSGRKKCSCNLPEDNGPMATYLFHYRSKEALKKERIIARSPSPSLAPGGDSEEEKKPVVKRERSSDSFGLDDVASAKSRRKRIKPEEDEEGLEVVDLTGSFRGKSPYWGDTAAVCLRGSAAAPT